MLNDVYSDGKNMQRTEFYALTGISVSTLGNAYRRSKFGEKQLSKKLKDTNSKS